MRVRARFHPHVQRELGVVRQRPEELLGEVAVEVRDGDRRQAWGVECRERAAGDVYCCTGARLVHRHDGMAEARDLRAVAQRLVDRLAERDAGVLHGVVRPCLEIALHAHVEVEPAVSRHGIEQVVEEADTRRARACAGAVERQREADIRLVGLA